MIILTICETLKVIFAEITEGPYWHEVVKNGLGCTLGSFLAIFVSYKIYRVSENGRKKQRLTYFERLIASSLEASKEMNTYLLNFIQAIRNDPKTFPELQYRPMNALQRISQMREMDETMFAFAEKIKKDKEKINKFEAIINTIDGLYLFYEKVLLQVEKGQNFDHDRSIAFREYIYSINNLVQKILAFNFPVNAQVGYVFGPLHKVYQQLAQAQQSKIHQYAISDVTPVNTNAINLLNSGFFTQDLYELENTTTRALKVYDSISKHNEDLANDIDTYTLQPCTKLVESLETLLSNYFKGDTANKNEKY